MTLLLALGRPALECALRVSGWPVSGSRDIRDRIPLDFSSLWLQGRGPTWRRGNAMHSRRCALPFSGGRSASSFAYGVGTVRSTLEPAQVLLVLLTQRLPTLRPMDKEEASKQI